MLGVVRPCGVSEVPDCNTALFCSTSSGSDQCGRLLWGSIGELSFTRLQGDVKVPDRPAASPPMLPPIMSALLPVLSRIECPPSVECERPSMDDPNVSTG